MTELAPYCRPAIRPAPLCHRGRKKINDRSSNIPWRLPPMAFVSGRKTARWNGTAALRQPIMPAQDRDMIIRDATEADVPEIQSIYAHHVLTGTGTFEEEPPSVEEMLARYRRIVEHGWRWLVAADAT